MDKNITKKFFIIYLSLLTLLLFLPLVTLAQGEAASQAAPTTPMTPIKLNVPIGGLKEVPGENPFGTYLKVWYGFIIGSVGILSTVMIMWAGLKWLTSRGNTAIIGEAKEKIFAAVIGLLLAFFSFIILNLINPDLVKLTDREYGVVNYSYLAGSHGLVTQTGQTNSPSQVCDEINNPIIDYSNVPTASNVPNVSQYDALFNQYGQQYGVDPDILRAIAGAESSGNPNAISSAGAYGLMQLLPSTASTVAGREVSGQELIDSPELSINLAAQFVSRNQTNLGVADIFAGYNGGYATTAGRPLSQSRDCPTPGVRAYQCCINPGGLTETQDYVQRGLSYYNHYHNQ